MCEEHAQKQTELPPHYAFRGAQRRRFASQNYVRSKHYLLT